MLLANLGNIDWRPVLNLWAVVQYVTKYATKAPKGSRKLQEVLKDAVGEVCTYVPEGEGSDFLRRSIQKILRKVVGGAGFPCVRSCATRFAAAAGDTDDAHR